MGKEWSWGGLYLLHTWTVKPVYVCVRARVLHTRERLSMHFTSHWGGGNWLYVSYTISRVSACVPVSLSGGIRCAHLTLWGK